MSGNLSNFQPQISKKSHNCSVDFQVQKLKQFSITVQFPQGFMSEILSLLVEKGLVIMEKSSKFKPEFHPDNKQFLVLCGKKVQPKFLEKLSNC